MLAVSLGGRGGGFEWFVESSVKKSGLVVVECEEIVDGVWVKIKEVKHSTQSNQTKLLIMQKL